MVSVTAASIFLNNELGVVILLISMTTLTRPHFAQQFISGLSNVVV